MVGHVMKVVGHVMSGGARGEDLTDLSGFAEVYWCVKYEAVSYYRFIGICDSFISLQFEQ